MGIMAMQPAVLDGVGYEVTWEWTSSIFQSDRLYHILEFKTLESMSISLISRGSLGLGQQLTLSNVTL